MLAGGFVVGLDGHWLAEQGAQLAAVPGGVEPGFGVFGDLLGADGPFMPGAPRLVALHGGGDDLADGGAEAVIVGLGVGGDVRVFAARLFSRHAFTAGSVSFAN